MKVGREVHRKIAFLLWGVVGVSLLVAGVIFVSNSGTEFNVTSVGLLGVGLALGLIKSRFVLNKVAKKNIQRIDTLPQESSVLATFSLKSWGLILVMILLGRTIRFLGAPYPIIGLIYMAVGFGLALSSRRYIFSD